VNSDPRWRASGKSTKRIAGIGLSRLFCILRDLGYPVEARSGPRAEGPFSSSRAADDDRSPMVMRKNPPSGARFLQKGLAILYEDKDIIVVNKPAGLLTVATEREKERTAHHILTEHIRRGCGRSRKELYVVHRLDRDTSGTLIFAKSEEVKLRLQDRWKETKKMYLAIVHGRREKSSGTITSYLAEDNAYTVYSTNDQVKENFPTLHIQWPGRRGAFRFWK
jgi:23S rRNA-/tRNA-specific pseudouridylate synthase